MKFTPKRTTDADVGFTKTLLYAHHGWGKTTQAKHFLNRYGRGFIMSGEAGLSSIRSAGIDYLPFKSWDGPCDEAAGIYSFKALCGLVRSEEFERKAYTWIMIDSLTELADLALAHHEADSKAKGAKNGFALWGDYATSMIGACKWVRDLPYHVIVTALAKEESNDDGAVEYWPMVKGGQVQKQLPGIFDHVLCGVRSTSGKGGEARVERYIVTDEVKGWHGKVRDEKRRLRPVEHTSDATELLERVQMEDSEYEAFLASKTREGTPA